LTSKFISMKKNKSLILLFSVLLLSGTGNSDYKSGHLPGVLPASYEVRFTYTGYTTFAGTAADCPVRTNGTVKLFGTLQGMENVREDDDIVYTGILQLDIDMDICSVKLGDPPKACSITVTGSGPVKTELTINFDARGGYIKIRDTTSRGFRKNAVGSCDLAEIYEERTMIPLKTIATIFNGLDLPSLTQRTLQPGRYVSRIAEGEIVIEVR